MAYSRQVLEYTRPQRNRNLTEEQTVTDVISIDLKNSHTNVQLRKSFQQNTLSDWSAQVNKQSYCNSRNLQYNARFDWSAVANNWLYSPFSQYIENVFSFQARDPINSTVLFCQRKHHFQLLQKAFFYSTMRRDSTTF